MGTVSIAGPYNSAGIDETPSRQAMKAGLAEVREKLGRAGASARAADEIAPFLIAKKR